MNICICDDDAVFCEELCGKLLALEPGAEVSVFGSSGELLRASACPDAKRDLFFLDIRLRDEQFDGIALAKRLSELHPAAQTVFVTAYPEYVSDVYETKHAYFIKKSELDVYLPKALEKASRLLGERPLVFGSQNGLVKVLPSEIRYIERRGRNSEIATCSGEFFTVRKSLGAVEDALSEDEFMCCHYSFIIPLRLIRSLNRSGVVLDGGTVIPVSRSHYAQLKLRFVRYMGGEL